MLDADGRSSDVWIFDLTRNATSRFTFDPYADGTPLWSPDGKRIIFNSNRLGGRFSNDLYEKSATGTDEEQLLLQSDSAKFATSWSRDGQFILYDEWAPSNKSGIWMLTLSRPHEPKALLQSNVFNQVQGQISSNGQFLAYTSDESGRPEVYVQRFPPASDKWQVSSGGGFQPLWRGDDKELFFCTEDQKIMSVDIKTGSAFASSIPRELFQPPMKLGFNYSYAVTSDGQRFLVSAPVEAGEVAPMTIVLNWSANLGNK